MLSSEFEAALKAAAEAQTEALSPESVDGEDEAVLAEFKQQLRDEAFGLDLPELGPKDELSDDGGCSDGT